MRLKSISIALLAICFGCGDNEKTTDAVQTQIERNFDYEMHEATDAAEREKIESKYEILREIYEAEKSQNSNITERNAKLEGREAYATKDYTSYYHPLVLDEVRRVFKNVGELYVKETNGMIDLESTHKPWAGYWYPLSDKSIYEGKDGQPGPLQLFDSLLEKMGHRGRVAEYEKTRHEGFSPDSWEGLCDLLGMASATSPEPKFPKTIHGITFPISMLKSLRTYAAFKWPHEKYGLSYHGNADSDGTYQNLKPEAWHQLVVSSLEQDKVIVIDDTSGLAVWYKPLFRYRYKIQKDSNVPHAYLVTAYPFLVKERKKETDLLTGQQDIFGPIYSYRLYVDENYKSEKGFRVIAGQWLEKAYDNHPKAVKVPLTLKEIAKKIGKEERELQPEDYLGSYNPEFNKYIKIYKELVY